MRSRENREDASSTLLTPDSPFSVGDKNHPLSPIPGPDQESSVVFCSSPVALEREDEWEQPTPSSSKPVDPTLAEQFSKYISDLCTSSNYTRHSKNFSNMAHRRLLLVYNGYIDAYGLTTHNATDLEGLLAYALQQWWEDQSKAQQQPHTHTRLHAHPGHAPEITDMACTCSIL